MIDMSIIGENPEKTLSEYFFHRSYSSENGELGGHVKVKLTINHNAKVFSVTPPFIGKNNFMFIGNSEKYLNWRMWIAVTEAIQEAIGYAVSELGMIEKPETNKNQQL